MRATAMYLANRKLAMRRAERERSARPVAVDDSGDLGDLGAGPHTQLETLSAAR